MSTSMSAFAKHINSILSYEQAMSEDDPTSRAVRFVQRFPYVIDSDAVELYDIGTMTMIESFVDNNHLDLAEVLTLLADSYTAYVNLEKA